MAPIRAAATWKMTRQLLLIVMRLGGGPLVGFQGAGRCARGGTRR